MNAASRERVKDLLSQAARLPAAERAAFIRRAAELDASIAAEALELLATLDDAAFMSAPTGAGFAANAPPSPIPLEEAGARIGRYKLLQLVGEGGFGSVYMAEQIEPVRRRVALKIIKAGMDTRQVVARFEAERQALALMDHPNIARVFDAGATDSGRPYFVMELVRGEPVTHYCDRQKLSVRQRLELFCDICNAVEHAHQKGIIHRDLKPSNVLISVADGHPLPKVIDFGIAKATAASLTDKTLFTEMHQLIGTPEYMSPEQADVHSVDVDTRSDIYSLGVLLYELLVGTTPLERRRLRTTPLAEMQRLIREEHVPRPSHRLATMAGSSGQARLEAGNPDGGQSAGSSVMQIAHCRGSQLLPLTRALRGDLDCIVMKCLEKDRRRRYATAGAVADDIGRYLARQPVLATPASAGYRLRKLVARHRVPVIAAASIALALLAGVIGTVLQARRANREARQASAVNEFMREVLTSVEPQNQGADVRLIDVLGKASASATERFSGDPPQEAQVRDLLAQVYYKLGMMAQAKAESRQAWGLWKAHAGADDLRSLASQLRYLFATLNLEDVLEAERIVADLLPRAQRRFGLDDPRTLDVRRCLAATHTRRGRHDEAESILLELRAHPRVIADDLRHTGVLQALCLVYRRISFGATQELSQASLARWEPVAREWAERSTRCFGTDADATLQAQAELAEVNWHLRRFAEAAHISRAVLDASGRRFGECHHLRILAMDTLACALASLGETREPAELQLRRIECVRAWSGSGGPVLLSAISDALRFLDHDDRPAQGEALARELVDALQQLGGGHDAMLLESEVHVARFMSKQGRLDEAETLFQSALSREAQLDGQAAAQLHLFYADQLWRRGLYEQAERELSTTVEILGDVRRGVYGMYPDDVILASIALYDAWGKPEQAEEYRRLLDEVRGERSLSSPAPQ